MRLIDVQNLEMKKFDRFDMIPEYAILSHMWSEPEVSFEDYEKAYKATRNSDLLLGAKNLRTRNTTLILGRVKFHGRICSAPKKRMFVRIQAGEKSLGHAGRLATMKEGRAISGSIPAASTKTYRTKKVRQLVS